MLKKIALSLSALCLLALATLVILELFMRLWLFAWPPVYQSLIEDESKIYLYVLGESTSEGVQYNDKISPAGLIAYQFNDSLDGRKIEIIKLAMPGMQVEYNYFKFLFETMLRPHSNGLVMIYSGINESINNVDDEHFVIWRMVQHSIVLSKLSYMLDLFGNSPRRYKYRYEQIIHLAKRHENKVMLFQLVGNIRDYEPDVHEIAFNDYPSIYGNEGLYQDSAYAEAEAFYEHILNTEGENAYVMHQLGKCKYALGKYDSAAILLKHVTEIDNATGYADWKNRILDTISRNEHVPLVPTYDRFVDSSEHGIIGYDLINDAHHPNLRGYCILGNEAGKVVGRLFSQSPNRSLTPDGIAAYYKFDTAFYANVYYKLMVWFTYEAFSTAMPYHRVAQLKYYRDKYVQLKPNPESLLISDMMIALLEKDKGAFLKHLQAMNASPNKDAVHERIRHGFKGNNSGEQIKKIVTSWQFENAKDRAIMDSFIDLL